MYYTPNHFDYRPHLNLRKARNITFGIRLAVNNNYQDIVYSTMFNLHVKTVKRAYQSIKVLLSFLPLPM